MTVPLDQAQRLNDSWANAFVEDGEYTPEAAREFVLSLIGYY
jgi:hypothetical protein